MEQGEPYSIPFTSFCMSAAAASQSSGVKAAREEIKRLRIDSGWSFKTDVKNFNKASSFGRGISIGPSPVRSHSSRISKVWQMLRMVALLGVIRPTSQAETVVCWAPTLAPKSAGVSPAFSRKSLMRLFNESPPFKHIIVQNSKNVKKKSRKRY